MEAQLERPADRQRRRRSVQKVGLLAWLVALATTREWWHQGRWEKPIHRLSGLRLPQAAGGRHDSGAGAPHRHSHTDTFGPGSAGRSQLCQEAGHAPDKACKGTVRSAEVLARVPGGYEAKLCQGEGEIRTRSVSLEGGPAEDHRTAGPSLSADSRSCSQRGALACGSTASRRRGMGCSGLRRRRRRAHGYHRAIPGKLEATFRGGHSLDAPRRPPNAAPTTPVAAAKDKAPRAEPMSARPFKDPYMTSPSSTHFGPATEAGNTAEATTPERSTGSPSPSKLRPGPYQRPSVKQLPQKVHHAPGDKPTLSDKLNGKRQALGVFGRPPDPNLIAGTNSASGKGNGGTNTSGSHEPVNITDDELHDSTSPGFGTLE